MQGVSESSWYDIKPWEGKRGGDTVENKSFLLSL